MNSEINGTVPDLSARRVLAKVVVTLPIPQRSDWSGNESSAAVRAHILQDGIRTRGAKRTLIGANARLERIWRQRLIAVLTGRSEFKHSSSLSATANVALSAFARLDAQRNIWRNFALT